MLTAALVIPKDAPDKLSLRFRSIDVDTAASRIWSRSCWEEYCEGAGELGIELGLDMAPVKPRLERRLLRTGGEGVG